MHFYTDANQIYTILQALFEQLRHATPNPVDALATTRLSIRLILTEPDAQVMINGKKRPVEIRYGPTKGRVDLEIGMTAEQLHLILLDEYSIKSGFANGDLKVRGQVWKALSLADIFIKGRSHYPEVLQDQGWN
jgi:hypothetical protein